jgi:hypothetical protein
MGIANSKTGYLQKCKIYLGKKEERNIQLGRGGQVVTDMIEDYMGLRYHAHFDNLFHQQN